MKLYTTDTDRACVMWPVSCVVPCCPVAWCLFTLGGVLLIIINNNSNLAIVSYRIVWCDTLPAFSRQSVSQPGSLSGTGTGSKRVRRVRRGVEWSGVGQESDLTGPDPGIG
jgi:hypothetical protein